jgi:hypothetical protein
VSHEGECPRLLPFIIGNSACTSRVGGKPEQAGRVTCLECRWLAPLRVSGEVRDRAHAEQVCLRRTAGPADRQAEDRGQDDRGGEPGEQGEGAPENRRLGTPSAMRDGRADLRLADERVLARGDVATLVSPFSTDFKGAPSARQAGAGPGRSHEYARDMHGERGRRSGLCCCGRGDGVSCRRWREAWPASSCAVAHRRGALLRCPAFHRFTAMSATSKKPRAKRRRSPTGHR